MRPKLEAIDGAYSFVRSLNWEQYERIVAFSSCIPDADLNTKASVEAMLMSEVMLAVMGEQDRHRCQRAAQRLLEGNR